MKKSVQSIPISSISVAISLVAPQIETRIRRIKIDDAEMKKSVLSVPISSISVAIS
jgi:hypothetical protein